MRSKRLRKGFRPVMKWYEEKDAENDVIVASRIRLLRNLRDYKFPWKLEEEDAKRLTKELEEKLCGIGSLMEEVTRHGIF
ncbi:hypothetical protein DWY36_00985 [Firmicutes bacterium AF25-13AC]|nr:hypothetical protein DWY36_00985 [Firmicutes bacterium AF25-13AC]